MKPRVQLVKLDGDWCIRVITHNLGASGFRTFLPGLMNREGDNIKVDLIDVTAHDSGTTIETIKIGHKAQRRLKELL